jgi:hypothetical protein
MKEKNHNITWLQTISQTEIMPQYQSLDSRERGKLRLAAMREWLDRNRYEPTKFNYDQDDEAVVLSVEFPNDQEAEAFAGRFDRKEPPGLTPLGV